MNIQNAYNEWSETYDTNENLTRDLNQEVTREILAGQHFQSILEIGCGTGKNTSFLAEIGASVHALDFSEGMIKRARKKVQAKNVRFDMADLTQRWPCKDTSYNLLVCCLVLEHIENLAPIFAEARRTLKSGGRFFINELHPFRQYQGTQARFVRGEETILVDAFAHHISDFLNAASVHGLKLSSLHEFWHEEDQGKPPRLISFMFEKGDVNRAEL